MTSAYSGVIESQVEGLGGYQSIQTIGAIQQAMQQKIDINKEKVNATLAEFKLDLIREEDQAVFASKMKTLEDMANNSGSINFLDNSLPSAIRNHFSQAIDQETIKQVVNTKNIRAYDATVQDRRDKGKGAYNEANDWYGRQVAGYDSYLKGETDDLGSLVYTDYVDVNEKLNKNFNTWLKNSGHETNVIQDGDMKSDFFTLTKTRGVSEARIKEYIQSQIQSDPTIQKQLAINGKYQYRGVSDESMERQRNFDIDRGITSNKEEILKIKMQKDLYKKNSSEYKQLSAVEEALLNQNDIYKNQMELPFNRDSYEYGRVVENLMNSYAKTNAKFEVLDIKYDDLPFSIRERKAKLSIAQERLNIEKQKLADKQKEEKTKKDKENQDPLVVTSPLGSNEERQGTYAKELETNLQTDLDITVQMAKNEFPEQFRGMSDEEVTNQVVSMAKNVNNRDFGKGYSPAFTSALDKIGNGLEVVRTHKKAQYDTFSESVMKNIYDGILDGKNINLDHLAKGSPYLAKSAKSGKRWNNLTQKEKDVIMVETALYSKDNILSDDKTYGENSLDYVLDYIKETNPDLDFNTIREENKPGFGTAVLGAGQFILGGLGMGAGNVKNKAVQAFYNIAGYDEEADRVAKEDLFGEGWFKEGAKKIGKGLGSTANALTSDSSIWSIQGRQFGGDKTFGKDPTEQLRNFVKSGDTEKDNVAKKFIGDELDFKKTVLLDPSVNKSYHNTAKQLAQFYNLQMPDKETIIEVQSEGPNLRLTIVPDSRLSPIDRKTAFNFRSSVLVPKEDAGDLAKIYNDEISRNNDPRNEYNTINKTQINYSIPEDVMEVEQTLRSLNKRDPERYNGEGLKYMQSRYLTKEDYRELIKGFEEDKIIKAEEIINQEYVITPYTDTSGNVKVVINKKTGEGLKAIKMYDYIAKYRPEEFESLIPDYMYNFINEQLIGIE